MASTPAGRHLTELHRVGQGRLGLKVVTAMRGVFHLLDPTKLDQTTTRWLDAGVATVRQHQAASATLAASYLTAYRAAELGPSTWKPPSAPPSPEVAIRTSLLVTGPVTIKAAMARRVPLDKAIEIAEVRSTGAAMRQALSGGRDTIIETSKADPAAVGVARATSDDPCAFCAMVASRGAVFSADTADFECHDHCMCEPEVSYHADGELPPGAAAYRELWDQATSGLSGGDAIDAFRAAFSS